MSDEDDPTQEKGGRIPTDPVATLINEIRGLRVDIQEHNKAASLRHGELLTALRAKDNAVQVLVDERGWWKRTLEKAAPYVWQALRTPLGALLLGVLVLGLAKALDVDPTTVVRLLAPPLPVQVQPQPQEEP